MAVLASGVVDRRSALGGRDHLAQVVGRHALRRADPSAQTVTSDGAGLVRTTLTLGEHAGHVARLLEVVDQSRETRPERADLAIRALDDNELLEALERIDDTAGPTPELPPVGADLPPRHLADMGELFEEAADTAGAEVAALAPDLQRLRDRAAHLERLQPQGYEIPTLAERPGASPERPRAPRAAQRRAGAASRRLPRPGPADRAAA